MFLLSVFIYLKTSWHFNENQLRLIECYFVCQKNKVGESILSSDCSQKCTCVEGETEMICENSDCAPNSMCTIKDAQRVCVCPPTHDGDGKTCARKFIFIRRNV